jgi:hypothetical protein
MPLTDSAFMAVIDRLPADFRALVHEFGWVIVRDMRADGHRDAAKLRGELEAWRARKQAAWAAEIPYARRANAG